MEGLDFRDTVTDFALPQGSFFDCATVHLLTTATLDRLRELYPAGRFEVRRFRPNIVVQTRSGVKDFVEDAWIGHTLAIGDAVRLGITGPCPRCEPNRRWRVRSEEHTSELQSRSDLVCRLLL